MATCQPRTVARATLLVCGDVLAAVLLQEVAQAQAVLMMHRTAFKEARNAVCLKHGK